MSKTLTVALVTTARRDKLSSMNVYADMIQHVVAKHSDNIQFVSANLRDSVPSFDWLPRRLTERLQLLWLMASASKVLSEVSADVYHAVDGSFVHVLKGSRHRNLVVTVHDLIPVLQSKRKFEVSPPGKLARWLIYRNIRSLSKVSYLCTDSKCTKADLEQHLDKQSRSIDTVPLTLRDSILKHLPETPVAWPERVEKSRAQDSNVRIIFHIGNNGFYKNRIAVLETYSRLFSDYSLRLVMAGAPPDDALLQRLDDLNINRDQVTFLPYPDDIALANLYSQASILLFPSYYEGFGWPPLEAMAFGCPVVCSNAGSLSEVVGDAALTALPKDYERLASHCRSILDDSGVAEKLINLGSQNVQRFSEKNMAQGLIAIYQKAASSVQTLG